ncbi:MAG TPA: ATP-binding protein [Actinomycetota bacterium]|nr:ATP-binding protein [Actinomycetota bacterium]
MRLRTRVTLVSAALMAVVLAATGVFVYLRVQTELRRTVDETLRSRADAGLLVVRETGSLPPDQPDDAFAQLIGPDGSVDVSSTSIAGATALAPGDLRAPTFTEREALTIEGEVVPARILAVPVPEGGVLVVGASLDDQRTTLARLAAALAIGGPLALILAVGVTWLLVAWTLRPVESMRAEAAAISAGDPGRRLAVPGTGDEIARLAETLNAMLGRLEEAIERERRFVDDASHELRTPLSNLKAELDLALRRARTADELELALRSASEEADRLARLADDLLVLARSDRGRLPIRREPVDVAEMVGGTVDSFAARATERGVGIDVRVPAELRADLDELRMRQALGNLLDNGLRYVPAGGRVSVAAERDDGSLRLEVRDDGPGFPSEFLPIAFEAFARPDASRSRPGGGTGLGLAIVAAVAQAHGGTAEAANLPGGGAVVVLSIPT